MTEVFVAGAYFGSPRTGVLTMWQARRKSWALPIFEPIPGRILIVFRAPIAFAITGFLHLVADGDAPDICTGLRAHAAYGLRSTLYSCCLTCCWRWRSTG
jgi:hypothetical protein